VRLCEPAVSVDIGRVAIPFVRAAVPICVAPSRNVTVPPVGVVAPVTCATVAFKFVDCPNVEWLTELVNVVVVLSTMTSAPVPVALLPLQLGAVPAA
jgi:hypothetical protein